MSLRAVIELATTQHGVITVEQAGQAGLPTTTLRRVIAREGWRRLQRGVFALPASQATFAQACQAVLLAAGPNAVLCRRSAGHLFGLLPEPSVVEVFLPESERSPGLHGASVHRTRTLRPGDVVTVDGLRVTSPTRTAIDLAAVLQPEQLRVFLIDGQQRRLLTLDRVDRRVARIGPVRGIGTVRRLVWELHPEQCDSILEVRVRALIRESGLPAPDPSPYPVVVRGRTLHVDIAWPSRRLALEVDGRGHHSSHRQLDTDHRRTNALILAGWRVMRVGWQRLELDPSGFLAELRAAIG